MEEGSHPDVRLGGLTGREDRRTAAHTVRRSPVIDRSGEQSLETGAVMEDEKERGHGDYAEGQEKDPVHDDHHEGSFAEGQTEEHGHASEGKHGDFAEGEEKDPDKPHHEGSFAEGEAEGHDHDG